MSVIPELGRQRQEDQQSKVILGYIVSSGPSWATGNFVLKEIKIKNMFSVKVCTRHFDCLSSGLSASSPAGSLESVTCHLGP